MRGGRSSYTAHASRTCSSHLHAETACLVAPWGLSAPVEHDGDHTILAFGIWQTLDDGIMSSQDEGRWASPRGGCTRVGSA